jgi:hypothetical protein
MWLFHLKPILCIVCASRIYFRQKHDYSKPINYNYWTHNRNWLQLFRTKLVYSELTTTTSIATYKVWTNNIDFDWIRHSLSQLQLFHLKYTYSELSATTATETHINWANCNFKAKHAYSRPTAMTSSEMRKVWSNYNYSKYNAKSLNQLLLFLQKCILSEPTTRFLT